METEAIQQSLKPASDSNPIINVHPETDMKPGITSHSQKIISGMRMEVVQLRIRVAILKIIFRNYKNLKVVFKIMVAFDRLRRSVLGNNRIRKLAYVDKKYYWDLYTPGYSSKTFTNFFEGEANRIVPLHKKTNRFTNIFIAFTKKCPLQCEHCFEWDALNQTENLTLSAIKDIVLKFQDKGTAQIQLTGGEPLLRIDDIIEILKSSKPATEFWILSSGYNLTIENSKKLKHAGLTGMVISLDHFDPNMHNQFRGFKKSFEWVQTAIQNSIAANLVTVLSICVTRSFVTELNLMKYAELAKSWGVSFIQILEPRAVGHYRGMDVSLDKEHEQILEAFYCKMNYDKSYRKYPIVTYHGYHQRKVGCFASGNRNLYVDTDGDLHACPFCQTKMGNALSNNLDSLIETLQMRGCHNFESSTSNSM
jgi:MoaA/NifB/PqqE/SkfB family radical SAM enzyme